MRSQILIVPFALYVCAMEKMLSQNADTAFVSNCDHDYNELAIWHVYLTILCSVPMYISVLRLELIVCNYIKQRAMAS